MAEFQETTNAEKLQIAQHFLLSSPPGQFNEVRTDVQKILPDDLLTEALAAGIAKVANTKNSKVVTAPSGSKVVLNAAGEIDATHYFDPSSGSVMKVDHLTLATQTAATVKSNQDPESETKRASLQSTVSKYISASYLSVSSGCGVFAKNGAFVLVLTGEKVNLNNFWSGSWNSVWSLSLTGSTFTLAGDIKIHAHYFEDGNLQLQTTKPVPATEGTFTSDEELGNAVVAIIRDQETLLQNSLGDMYENMSEQTIKSLRRVMPITRTKMEWNINSVRMNKQVRK